jgi:hypothetical protein
MAGAGVATGRSAVAKSGGQRVAVWALAWLASYAAVRLGVELVEPGSAPGVAMALVPVVPFSGFILSFIASVRAADELERRIHLEALAVAFPATLVMMMVLGLLDLVLELNPSDWSYRHLWPLMVVFWLFGQWQARRRYT